MSDEEFSNKVITMLKDTSDYIKTKIEESTDPKEREDWIEALKTLRRLVEYILMEVEKRENLSEEK